MENAKFSTEEMVDMIFILGECMKNVALAVRVYHERYPDRRTPHGTCFQKLLNRFTETGSVAYAKHRYPKPIANEMMEFNVVGSVIENPHVSQRELSRDLQVSKSTVQRILKQEKFHPYRIVLTQELHGDDFEQRVNFCEFMLQELRNNPNVTRSILFTDEASFKSNGVLNRHNCHYYATENPRWNQTVDNQRVWSLNVWGGVIANYVIGPYFFNGYLRGDQYLLFLQNELPVLLENVTLDLRNSLIFQHDGAPAHSSLAVTNHLNNTYRRWIGRHAPIRWPARSPDLTVMDYFLWGHVKDEVYKERPTTPENMKQRIREAFHSVTDDMLVNARTAFRRRLEKCVEVSGDTFEHLP